MEPRRRKVQGMNVSTDGCRTSYADTEIKNGEASYTYGVLEPTMLTQMAKYLDTVYVSGWQCSSTASSTDEPSPDLADYPMVREDSQFSSPQLLTKSEYCSQQSSTAFFGSTFPRP